MTSEANTKAVSYRNSTNPENAGLLCHISESNPTWISIVVIGVCITAWAVFLPGTFPRTYIYIWDSAAYIETAGSIHAGRGLMQRVIHGIGNDFWEPISWWPPGYPIIIALVQMTGISGPVAGVIVAVVAAAVSVILSAYICLRLFHWSLAVVIVLATICMPIFLQISTQCMSDSTYLGFSLASILCLLFWKRRFESSRMWLVAAGLFAGASWATRYTGSSLIAASAILLSVHIFWMRPRDVARNMLCWLSGVAILAGPLMIHNFLTFGKIIPYDMPPSDLSLWTNLRRFGRVIVYDMTTSILVANIIASKYMVPFYAVGIIIGGWFWRRTESFRKFRVMLQVHWLPILMVVYVLLYGAVVVAARTKYRWGEEIDPRHLVQIYWILWIFLAVFGSAILQSCGFSNKFTKRILICGFLLVAILQTGRQIRFLSSPPGQQVSIHSTVGDQGAQFLAGAVAKNQIVLSTRADLLRTHCEINARKIPPVSQYDFLQPITRNDIERIGDSGFLWGIVIEDIEGARKGEYDLLIKDIVENPDHYGEFQRVQIESPALIFKYQRKPIQSALDHYVEYSFTFKDNLAWASDDKTAAEVK